MNDFYVSKYKKPSATATIIPYCKEMVVLIKRSEKAETYPSELAFPGGFLDVGIETIEECAVRELMEETGIAVSPESLKLLTISSHPSTDPRDHVVNVVYMVKIDQDDCINATAGDDASEIVLKKVDEMFDLNMAFNHNNLFTEFYEKMKTHREFVWNMTNLESFLISINSQNPPRYFFSSEMIDLVKNSILNLRKFIGG